MTPSQWTRSGLKARVYNFIVVQALEDTWFHKIVGFFFAHIDLYYGLISHCSWSSLLAPIDPFHPS